MNELFEKTKQHRKRLLNLKETNGKYVDVEEDCSPVEHNIKEMNTLLFMYLADLGELGAKMAAPPGEEILDPSQQEVLKFEHHVSGNIWIDNLFYFKTQIVEMYVTNVSKLTNSSIHVECADKGVWKDIRTSDRISSVDLALAINEKIIEQVQHDLN